VKEILIGPGVVEWVAKRTGEHGSYGSAVGIGLTQDDRIIAGVVFNEYNGVNMNMHVASDGSKRWMTREYLWTVFDYPFNQAKVNRLTGLVGEGNVEAQLFDEHIGFRLETTLEGAHPSGDLLVYVMWKRDCKWLNIRRPHRELQQMAA
jgi:RimJ/RimL family protein N-acetyltransferase